MENRFIKPILFQEKKNVLSFYICKLVHNIFIPVDYFITIFYKIIFLTVTVLDP